MPRGGSLPFSAYIIYDIESKPSKPEHRLKVSHTTLEHAIASQGLLKLDVSHCVRLRSEEVRAARERATSLGRRLEIVATEAPPGPPQRR